MDVDLPVWTIRPNWKNGVLERLEFLTDVLPSDSGVEQRASARLSPRRSFEFTVNPTKQDRTYLDLALHRLGGDEWLVPLWHDQGVLTGTAEPGDNGLLLDNRWREHVDGGLALLYLDTFTWEVVEVDSQTNGAIYLTAGIDGIWPKGTRVFPLRRMFARLDSSIAAITRRVGESRMLWQINETNDFDDNMPAGTTYYNGAPIITIEPNRSANIDINHVRFADEADGQAGLIERLDTVNRAFQVQSHNWMVRGREAQHNFRRTMYYLSGRRRSVWLPSFTEDVVVSRPVAEGANAVAIEKVGFTYLGGPMPGRSRIWTGKEVLRHSGMAAAPSTAEEALTLADPTEFEYDVGAPGSFLGVARLDTDTIEIQHYTDSDGVFECGATFRTFADDRETPEPIHLPIPVAVLQPFPCGTPDDTPCTPLPCKPKTIFKQIYTNGGCNIDYCPQRNWYMPAIPGRPPGYEHIANMPITIGGITGPTGASINVNNSVVNGCAGNRFVAAYERDDYINPESQWYQDPRAINLQGQELVVAVAGPLDWTIEVFGALAMIGGGYQMQYGAFYCGSTGGTGGSGKITRTTLLPPDCSAMTVDLVVLATGVGDDVIVGNVPYGWFFD